MRLKSSVAPMRFSSSCHQEFWSRGIGGGIWDALAIVIFEPLPGTAVTDLKEGGGVRKASGTFGAGEGSLPPVGVAGTAGEPVARVAVAPVVGTAVASA